ncbi:hypothetical protein MUK70_15035 [Dyadobacter chenwenxiniae]|uniref:Uncharacterized protein n=1 Tax=Dyadobacter chenwenxiniae TaxID=2906456 RepID=A0A9X1PH70_9BACT|nr:hypothetical protein [Dyadobacter chenwenxiniae]MCF0051646.1 hypothetical protein [Dyadobacter chenwenxiniae]MCF0060556.1 hypothetical protein [Dyadobacter chenwenxiniae]UON86287.1 hypothetical protein MUK70_15035 [Dyadobacter chenwenxiniae]
MRENLSWIHNDEEGTIEPLTILGALNVDLDKQIKEIDLMLGSLEEANGHLADFKSMEESFAKTTAEFRKKDMELDECNSPS